MSMLILAFLLLAGCALPAVAHAQNLQDLHRITDGTSRSHFEYHRTSIPKGKEVVLAELTEPGRVAYFYITGNMEGRFYPGLALKSIRRSHISHSKPSA